MPDRKRQEWPVLAAIFLDLCGFSAILVDLQFRAEKMGAPGWTIGGILASTFLVQAIVSPLWGQLSDRIGRKTCFILASGLSALSMVIYALAGSPLWLLVSRVAAGGGAANTSIAQAAMADAFSGDERNAAMGRLSAVLNGGLILGPVLGGWVGSTFGSSFVGWAAAAASALGLLIAAALAKMKPGSLERQDVRFTFGGVIRDCKPAAPFFFASVAAWFSLAMLEGTFGRLIERRLGLGQVHFGIIFAFESVVGVLVSAFLVNALLRKGRERQVLASSYVLMGLGLALMPIAPAFAWLFPASFLFAGGQGFASPAVNALCSRAVDESRQGELFGLMQGARSIGFIAGPIMGGALFDANPPAPYFVAGGVCAVAALIVLRFGAVKPP